MVARTAEADVGENAGWLQGVLLALIPCMVVSSVCVALPVIPAMLHAFAKTPNIGFLVPMSVVLPTLTIALSSLAAGALGLVNAGNTPLYAFFPGSDVRQNAPNFNAEFKTTLGNDTVLFRPYTAAINRLIDGT